MNQHSKAVIDSLRANSKPLFDNKDAGARDRCAKILKDTAAAVVKALRDARAVVRGIKLDQLELKIKES